MGEKRSREQTERNALPGRRGSSLAGRVRAESGGFGALLGVWMERDSPCFCSQVT